MPKKAVKAKPKPKTRPTPVLRAVPRRVPRPKKPAAPDLATLSIEELDHRGALAFRSGRFVEAGACFGALLGRLNRAGPPDDPEGERIQGEAELRLGTALRRVGKLKEAKNRTERAIGVAASSPEVQTAGHALLCELHLLAGNLPLARLSADHAATISGAHDGLEHAWAVAAQARLLWAAGSWEEASQAFIQAHHLCRRHGDLGNAAILAGDVGMCLLELGRLPDARNWVRRAAEEAREKKLPAVEATWLGGLARIALAEGAHDEAARLAEAALTLARKLGSHLTVFRAEWLLHYLFTLADPREDDRARMASLRRLRPALSDYLGDREVQELVAALRPKGRPAERVASFTEGCDPVPFVPAG